MQRGIRDVPARGLTAFPAKIRLQVCFMARVQPVVAEMLLGLSASCGRLHRTGVQCPPQLLPPGDQRHYPHFLETVAVQIVAEGFPVSFSVWFAR